MDFHRSHLLRLSGLIHGQSVVRLSFCDKASSHSQLYKKMICRLEKLKDKNYFRLKLKKKKT